MSGDMYALLDKWSEVANAMHAANPRRAEAIMGMQIGTFLRMLDDFRIQEAEDQRLSNLPKPPENLPPYPNPTRGSFLP